MFFLPVLFFHYLLTQTLLGGAIACAWGAFHQYPNNYTAIFATVIKVEVGALTIYFGSFYGSYFYNKLLCSFLLFGLEC